MDIGERERRDVGEREEGCRREKRMDIGERERGEGCRRERGGM